MNEVTKLAERTGMSRYRAINDALDEVRDREPDGVLVIYVHERDNGEVTIGYACARMDTLVRLGAIHHIEHMVHDDLRESLCAEEDSRE